MSLYRCPNQLIYTHTQTTAGCIFRNNFLSDISFGMPSLQTATFLIHLLSFWTFLIEFDFKTLKIPQFTDSPVNRYS